MKFIRINPVKNIQALECAKKIRAQRSHCAIYLAAILLLQAVVARAVEPAVAKASGEAPAPASESTQTAQNGIPFDRLLRRSYNPIDAYRGKTAPPPSMANSARLDTLVRDGKIYLSLRDAIDLALEDNLDMVIARYTCLSHRPIYCLPRLAAWRAASTPA